MPQLSWPFLKQAKHALTIGPLYWCSLCLEFFPPDICSNTALAERSSLTDTVSFLTSSTTLTCLLALIQPALHEPACYCPLSSASILSNLRDFATPAFALRHNGLHLVIIPVRQKLGVRQKEKCEESGKMILE